MHIYLSIIIPFYNRERFVKSSLDSIFSQGLSLEQFEVICVDDCSPTLDNYNALNNYTYEGIKPSNLVVVRHEVNKCQGGARNTGISNAKGTWVIHLDSDDFFIKGSLSLLYEQLKTHEDLDILMYGHATKTSAKSVSHSIPQYQKIDGLSLVKKYHIPWVSWSYAFKRSFLVEKDLKFAENVRVEDGDYVYRAVMNASAIAFAPISVVYYCIQDDSVSSLPINAQRIEWNVKMAVRFKKIAEDFMIQDKEAAMVCIKISSDILLGVLPSYLGILSPNDILYLIKKYRIYEGNNIMLRFAYKCPRLFAICCLLIRPIYKQYRSLKGLPSLRLY